MFTKNTYLIKCHVCGRIFTHIAEFISGAMREELPDGRNALLITCNLEGEVHPPEEVRASWQKLNG